MKIISTLMYLPHNKRLGNIKKLKATFKLVTFTRMTRFHTHKHKKEFLNKRRRVLCDMKEIILVREIKNYKAVQIPA